MSAFPDRSLVRLHPVDETHVDFIMRWVNDRDIIGNLAAFSGKPFSREDELAWVRRMQSSSEDRVFSIFDAVDDRYVGQCGVHQIFRRSAVGRASIIIADRAEMGRGKGSAALASLLDFVFSSREGGGEDLHKVWLMLFAKNERARRTYARLGFVEEGLLREEYFHEDGWHDMVRMSLLRSEWPGKVSDGAQVVRR